jgi:hypothetical protein
MFDLILILYWLALSTWFGGVLFVAIAAPVIFRTVHEYKPTLPLVLSVNLENQHGTLLAGSIVANLLAVLIRVELVCASVVFVTMLAQWFFIERNGTPLVAAILRSSMYLAAVALVLYDWRIVWPKAKKYRQEYLDHADEPEIANPAIDEFERYDRENLTVIRNLTFLLLGIILFSGNIRVASTTFAFH